MVSDDAVGRDAMLLDQTHRLLEWGTPGPVVKAIIEEMTSNEFTVLPRGEFIKLRSEPDVVTKVWRDEAIVRQNDREKSDRRIRTRLELIERAIAAAHAEVVQASKPVPKKNGDAMARKRRAHLKDALSILDGAMGTVREMTAPMNMVAAEPQR